MIKRSLTLAEGKAVRSASHVLCAVLWARGEWTARPDGDLVFADSVPVVRFHPDNTATLYVDGGYVRCTPNPGNERPILWTIS